MQPKPSYAPDVVVSVDQVSKKFCKHLRRSMMYGMVDLATLALGRPIHTDMLRRDEFWALQDISFTVKRGESLGILGLNGSGKTTLLRLLAGILPPDRGELYTQGRVSNLLARGAGFHPHMTGYENIFLNGSILGMSRAEIDQRISEIASFANLDDFIEAPVSTYSAGMKARLGFAIATSFQPDLLLLDEVLAVGDVVFRQRSLERMEQLLNHAAVVLASNHTHFIEKICTHAIWLDAGQIAAAGPVDEVISQYMAYCRDENKRLVSMNALPRTGTGAVRYTDSIQVTGAASRVPNLVRPNEGFMLEAPFQCNQPLTNVRFVVELQQMSDNRPVIMETRIPNIASDGRLYGHFPKLHLHPDVYILHLRIETEATLIDHWNTAATFTVERHRIPTKKSPPVNYSLRVETDPLPQPRT